MERLNGYMSIDQIATQFLSQKTDNGKINDSNQISFEEVLNKQRSIAEILDTTSTSGVRFSKHAGNRLVERNIELSDEQMQRLNDGAKRASEKGIKESLVILDNYSFIVNVKNGTVITAMDQNYEEENIYTNIDGAVIV